MPWSGAYASSRAARHVDLSRRTAVTAHSWSAHARKFSIPDQSRLALFCQMSSASNVIHCLLALPQSNAFISIEAFQLLDRSSASIFQNRSDKVGSDEPNV